MDDYAFHKKMLSLAEDTIEVCKGGQRTARRAYHFNTVMSPVLYSLAAVNSVSAGWLAYQGYWWQVLFVLLAGAGFPIFVAHLLWTERPVWLEREAEWKDRRAEWELRATKERIRLAALEN